MNDSPQSRLVRYITTNIERNLLLSMDEAIRSGYDQADAVVREHLKNTDPARLRSQLRRYMVDDALAGVLEQGSPSVLQTIPKGEHYVVVCSGNVTLSHIELNENALPRPAKHRCLLARKNAILEPIQYDLFTPSPPALDEALHIVIVVLHPDKKEKFQSSPREIWVAVPYTDWTGYHLEMPIHELLQSYDVAQGAGLVDEAWPTLRDDLQKEEQTTAKKPE